MFSASYFFSVSYFSFPQVSFAVCKLVFFPRVSFVSRLLLQLIFFSPRLILAFFSTGYHSRALGFSPWHIRLMRSTCVARSSWHTLNKTNQAMEQDFYEYLMEIGVGSEEIGKLKDDEVSISHENWWLYNDPIQGWMAVTSLVMWHL